MNLDAKEAGKQLLKKLIDKQKLSAEETEERFQMASSIDHWKALNPQLNVCAYLPFDDLEVNKIEKDEQVAMLEKLKNEKYFKGHQPIIKKEVTDKMLLAVENLRNAGWHELFAFVYDEFWQVLRTPSVLKLLDGVLGENGKALPHAAVHYVHPETGTGWSPHIDFYDRKKRFTLWFSISDATIDNGCMYVVAGHKISAELLAKWIEMKELTHKEVKTILQATHALPVPAGSFLGWEGDLIHWGTMSSANVQARVSLSVVYLKEGTEAMPDELPLLSTKELPNFAERMLTVAKALHQYSVHVLALKKFGDLSRKITERYKPDTGI